jgi:signal transduction histidine kinase
MTVSRGPSPAQRIAGLLLIGFIALMAIVGTTYWLGLRTQTYFDEVLAARNARSAAAELRNSLTVAESSQRGFIFTGNEIYLAPYDTAKMSAERNLASVKATLASYPETAESAEKFTEVVQQKFAEMDQTIALKRLRRDTELDEIVRSNRGKVLMDETNIFISGAIRASDKRLADGVEEHRANTATLQTVSVIGGFAVILMVAGAGAAAFRYTRELKAARDEVTLANTALEERVRARTADLARVNDEVQRFAYIVTHDLRAPLVNIMGFTTELEGSVKAMQALIDKTLADADLSDQVVREARLAATEDLPEAIGFIRSSTRKMDRLINAILRISREGGRNLKPEPIDLNELVRFCSDAVQHQVIEADGKLSISGPFPPIVSDRLSLEHILGNLFDNAVKYRSKDRPLEIAVRGGSFAGERVWLEVADNGRGIANQDLERVFELFRRSGLQDQPGEGIGLAYVRTVVRNLGGDIDVTSRLDEGATFRISLPRILHVQKAKSE